MHLNQGSWVLSVVRLCFGLRHELVRVAMAVVVGNEGGLELSLLLRFVLPVAV